MKYSECGTPRIEDRARRQPSGMPPAIIERDEFRYLVALFGIHLT